MKIGEVSSQLGYQGQGSQVKTAPVQQVETESQAVDFTTTSKIQGLNEEESTNLTGSDEENQKGQTSSSLKDAVDKINSANSNTEAIFGIHEGTNRVTIKMVDKETRKVIKEFPPEQTLDLIAKAWELAGIMVDEKR